MLSVPAACKVAGHELRCCAALLQAAAPGIHVPLMCLVDFAGYRLVASSVLPISQHTLVVGTPDGGKTLRVRPSGMFTRKEEQKKFFLKNFWQSSDSVLLGKLRDVGKFLNVKEHAVGQVVLPMAADLEGHYSPTDRRYYLVDFSRALPPDVGTAGMLTNNPCFCFSIDMYWFAARGREALFSRMIRPELVMRSSVPLNPDAFSGFRGTCVGDDVTFSADCEDVKKAGTSLLVKNCFSLFFRVLISIGLQNDQCVALRVELERLVSAADCSFHDLADGLPRLFHFFGVNMRYLGKVRLALPYYMPA